MRSEAVRQNDMINRFFSPLLAVVALSLVLAGLSGCGGGSTSSSGNTQAASDALSYTLTVDVSGSGGVERRSGQQQERLHN